MVRVDGVEEVEDDDDERFAQDFKSPVNLEQQNA